jgi:hypothetical protein
MLPGMAAPGEVWIPLVDEPIGAIVAQVVDQDRELVSLVGAPRQALAFRTFAYIRVGILLGQLLVESELAADVGGSWVETLMEDAHNRELVSQEVHAVAREVAADPAYASGAAVGPDEAARERFRVFARERLGTID